MAQLETESIIQFWDRASEIRSKMETPPIAAEHAPYLDFGRLLAHTICALLPSVFGGQVEGLLSAQYYTLDDLLTKLIAIEKNKGWKPKLKNLILYNNNRGGRGGNRGTRGSFVRGCGNSNHGTSPSGIANRAHLYANEPNCSDWGYMRGSFGRGQG
ncbi:hypothetical protein HDU78_009670 [Chytriomyces hyalinus]|nr:hypothetical protein HDU78_009670 [Chytriomyces hyalinus]